MRTSTHTEDECQRSVIMFDSFHDAIQKSLEKDYRSEHMNGDRENFYGVKDMREAHDLARSGLPHKGVTAIKLASQAVSDMQGQMVKPQFYETNDVSGAVVDMGRYVEGVPECMVEYYPTDLDSDSKIVSLIMNISYNCGISEEAITKQGNAMMGLVEAIELHGKQAEIWTDMHVSGWGDDNKVYCRTAVRLKKAGEPLDVGMFMYALTHPSYLRAIMFNVMQQHPAAFRKACGIGGHGWYGSPVTDAQDMDDFPPYSIYIPTIRDNSQAGKFVSEVLGQMGLLTA